MPAAPGLVADLFGVLVSCAIISVLLALLVWLTPRRWERPEE